MARRRTLGGMRWACAAVATGLLSYALPAHAADEETPARSAAEAPEPRTLQLRGLHLQYGIGGAFGHERAQPGIRHDLDAGALFGFWRPRARESYHSEGVLFGGAVATGFLSWPTYALGEVGYGESEGTAGYALVAGPAVRVASAAGVGGGATVRGALWAWGVEVGVRAVGIVGPYPELQLTLLLGLGVN